MLSENRSTLGLRLLSDASLNKFVDVLCHVTENSTF